MRSLGLTAGIPSRPFDAAQPFATIPTQLGLELEHDRFALPATAGNDRYDVLSWSRGRGNTAAIDGRPQNATLLGDVDAHGRPASLPGARQLRERQTSFTFPFSFPSGDFLA